MSRNIKEIGKELMGKSLNSFHRKTGLPQLEENNKMQDGILDGILSQVDDAYIEKTEQSNVIHLEGSGDGVVVLDSIEGNTKVNLIKKMSSVFSRTDNVNKGNNYLKMNHCLKPNTKYTRFVKVEKMTLNNNNVLLMCDSIDDADGTYRQYSYNITKTGWYIDEITIPSNGTTDTYVINPAISHFYEGSGTSIEISNIMIVEGSKEDNATIIDFFEGLQSSFEEKVNDEGKYEIEILSRNKNLIDKEYFAQQLLTKSNITRETFNGKDCLKINSNLSHTKVYFGTNDNEYKTLRFSAYTNSTDDSSICHYGVYLAPSLSNWSNSYGAEKYNFVEIYNYVNERIVYIDLDSIQLEYGTSFTNYTQHKQNKIKLLINEPLRAVDNTKDRLCIKDNKLVVERNIYSQEISPNIGYIPFIKNNHLVFAINPRLTPKGNYGMCNMFTTDNHGWQYLQSEESDNREFCQFYSNFNYIHIKKSRLSSYDAQGVNEWLLGNKVVLVYPLEEPYYEEVLNEYGEPILLEGYENGTIYIDSTIVPTTTVRYTPKMESFKTLNEVSDNNTMLANDINDNIIPYMMDVDFMIMEKEMALMSHKNIRTIGVKDMTSMQKRTQDMLERLIKGKTLTEQECKTRVTTYLNAGKITDAQAEELMLLIDEVYA